MRAISLWQPWASAMALGLKTIETRGWPTFHRGLLAIHAAKRWTHDERNLASNFAHAFGVPELMAPPLGAIVAVVDLYDCASAYETQRLGLVDAGEALLGNYAQGRFAWRTRNLLKLPDPVPYRGAQGFFQVPDDLMNAAVGIS